MERYKKLGRSRAGWEGWTADELQRRRKMYDLLSRLGVLPDQEEPDEPEVARPSHVFKMAFVNVVCASVCFYYEVSHVCYSIHRDVVDI